MLTPDGQLVDPRLSPDGRFIAAIMSGPRRDVYLYEVARRNLTRIAGGAPRRSEAERLLSHLYAGKLTAPSFRRSSPGSSLLRSHRQCYLQMNRPVAAIVLVIGMLLLTAPVGCSDATGPGRQRIVVISGGGVSDVVGAVLPEPLVIQVLNAMGRPHREADVEITTTRTAGNSPHIWLISSNVPDVNLAYRTTDAVGQFSVPIRFGDHPGPAYVRVVVPSLNSLTDSVQFTILPAP